MNYSGSDLRNTVGVISSIQWIWWHIHTQWTRCQIYWVWWHKHGGLRSLIEDVMSCIGQTMPHIRRVWCHKNVVCDFMYTLVWRRREWLWCLMYSVYVALHTGCCFIYRGCDVISAEVWWYNELIWCYIDCIWCHTYSGYDVIQKWVWYQWTGCDGKDRVGVIYDTVVVMRCPKWMWHPKYCGFVW